MKFSNSFWLKLIQLFMISLLLNLAIISRSYAADTPTNFHVSAVSKVSVTLSWDAVPGATLYQIQYDDTNPMLGPQGIFVSPTLTSATITVGQCEKKYYFAIRAIDSASSSPYSEIISATTLSCVDAPSYTCSFKSPFDQVISLKSKVNKAIPVKIELRNSEDVVITPDNIAGAAPVISVSFLGVDDEEAVDVTDLLEPKGNSSVGNILSFNAEEQLWQYNLDSSVYKAPGSYTVKISSGSEADYSIESTCENSFTRKK